MAGHVISPPIHENTRTNAQELRYVPRRGVRHSPSATPSWEENTWTCIDNSSPDAWETPPGSEYSRAGRVPAPHSLKPSTANGRFATANAPASPASPGTPMERGDWPGSPQETRASSSLSPSACKAARPPPPDAEQPLPYPLLASRPSEAGTAAADTPAVPERRRSKR